MSVSFYRAFMAFAWAVALSPSLCIAVPFGNLMEKVPDGANVLVLVNVEQILQSDFARSRDSQKKLAEAFEERSLLIPPHATQFVLAAQYDLDRRSQIWEAAVMELKTPLNLDRAAREMQRSVEKLAGFTALGTNRAFVLDLGDKVAGVLVPCNRQHAARWAQQLKRSSSPLSSYLAQIGSYGDTAGTDIILAIDLTDVLPQQFVANKLSQSDVLKGRQVDIEKVASLLAGMRGVRLGIKIGEKCYAKLVIDLQDDAAPLADFAKPLILSALGGAGVMFDDMNDWKVSVDKQTVALEGYLSDIGLQRLMGVVELPKESLATVDSSTSDKPRPAPATETPPSSTATADESLQREASHKYFKDIERRLDSLRLQKNDANTNGQIAAFIDIAARQIDRYSTLNVDSELADYGATLTSELRELSAALKGIGIKSGGRQAGIYSGFSSYYGDASYANDSYVQSARRQVRAEEKAAGAMSSMEIVQKIANQSAAIRRSMTDRYKIAF